nr:carbohydrate porin [Candidatus Chlamydia sanziniae]
MFCYGVAPQHPEYHHHRYADRLKKKHPKPLPQSPQPSEDILKTHSHSLLSPINKFFTVRPWDNGLSFSKLTKAAEEATNTKISLDATILPQWSYPVTIPRTATEEMPSWQFYFSPNVSWQLYNSLTAGTGSIDFTYTIVRYWKNTGINAGKASGIASGINDYTSREDNINQLTFSQTFPRGLWTLVLGQYSLYAIDGTLYDNDQQSGFISYALSQNASATYSLGSVGTYMQCTPHPQINIQLGFQDAFNINGVNFAIYNLTRNKYNFYGYVSWAPQSKCGNGQYSALIYSTRRVPQQESQTTGWSLNAGQYLGEKLYIFGRWNGATGKAMPVNRSFVGGLVLANPFNRNSQDLFGLGGAINKVNPKAISTKEKTRRYETVIETFATLGFGPHISLTPDMQIYIHPALCKEKRTARVYGIRTNLSL